MTREELPEKFRTLADETVVVVLERVIFPYTVTLPKRANDPVYPVKLRLLTLVDSVKTDVPPVKLKAIELASVGLTPPTAMVPVPVTLITGVPVTVNVDAPV
jgi:hypothetical protein